MHCVKPAKVLVIYLLILALACNMVLSINLSCDKPQLRLQLTLRVFCATNAHNQCDCDHEIEWHLQREAGARLRVKKAKTKTKHRQLLWAVQFFVYSKVLSRLEPGSRLAPGPSDLCQERLLALAVCSRSAAILILCSCILSEGIWKLQTVE